MKNKIKNTFKIYISLLQFLFILNIGYSQSHYTARNFIFSCNSLTTPFTGAYQARDYISMQKGSFQEFFQANLNENLIFPITYQTPVDASTRTLNTSSCKYGSIPGSFSVSPTGAATYSIPLFTSPGTNRMMPSINISYNSYSGNGLLGIGFNLNCISSITRVGQNLYNDNAITNINFTSSDRFALDGNRLICVSGTYGVAGAEYRTESETFSKIIQNSDNSFTVTSKNGSIIRYGFTGTINNSGNYSKMSLVNDNGPILNYFISDITDGSGNYIKYYYNKDYTKNEYWIDRIEYTGNDAAGITPYNQIKFIYEYKTDDISTSFVNGYILKNSLLLKKIKVFAETNVVRTYEMNYIFDRYSFLNEIIEKDATGNQFNSTAFSWTNYLQNDSYSIITPIAAPCNSSELYSWNYYGDFNGDGRTDIIEIDYNEHTLIPYAANMYINNIDGSWFTCSQIRILIDESFRGLSVCDYNGDGLDDIIIKKEGNNGNYFSLYFSNYNNGSENFIGAGNIVNETNTFSALETTADFDGDGKDELLTFQVTMPPPTGTPITYWARIVGNTQSNIILTLNTLPYKVLPCDFNGDGKKDIMLIFDLGCKILDGNLQTVLYDSGYPTRYHKIYKGDFNGDGKTDILTYGNGSWEMYYSNGFGFYGVSSQSKPPISTIDPDASNISNNISIGDFNGDGTSDILEYTANGHVNLYYMNGQKYFAYSFDIPNFNNFIAEQNWDMLVDFNGDGKMDITLQRAFLLDFITFNPKTIKNKVKCIVDGLNRKTEISYDYLTNINYNNSNVYTKGTNANYPIVDVQIPLAVVHYTHEEDLSGNGNCIFNTLYHYTGAKINSLGKGFFGFQTFEKTNLFSKQKLNFNYVLEYSKSNSFFYTYLEKEENYNCDNTTFPPTYNLIGSTTITTSIHNFGNQRIFPYTHNIESEDYLNKIHTKKVYEYDHANWDYGNLLSVKNYFLDGSTVLSGTEETFSNYINAGGWCPNKYTSKTIVYSRAGTPNKTRTTNYAWYPNGLLLNEVNDINVTTTFLYDACGNPTQIKVSGLDIADRITTMEYDQPKRRFVIKATNPEGHITEQQYEAYYGNPIWSKDENGLVTTNNYDAFGQLKETTLPTGVKVNYTTDWANGQGPANTIGYGKVESNGAANIEYKDKLGRTTRTITEGYNGKEIYSDNIYNNKGQLWKTSFLDPFNSVQWTAYSYDINGRIKIVESPNTTITTDYSVLPTGLQIVKTNTTANPVQTSITKYDLTGAIFSINDAAGGLLSYTYNCYMQPLTINSVGYTTTLEYDDFGRQTKLIDPDSKTTSYEYYSTGELKKQTDGKNNISQMTYDKLGRIKTNNISNDGSYTYLYDTRSKGIGNLSSIFGPNGMETHFEYNQFGWNNKITEVIPGQSNFITNCTYDIYGNNTQITYPSGYTINRMFDNKGNLIKVTQASDNKVIWELNSTDYMGNIDQYKTANNNVTVNYGFDHNTGNLNEIKYTRNDKNTAIFDYSYSFDAATGNLMSRTDKTRPSLTESFLYDNLERLTNWGNKETTYNPSGTIKYKSDIMAPGNNYAYTQSFGHGAYQISGVDPNAISINPQDITYNSFNKISTVNEGLSSMSFIYGTDQSRKKVLTYNNDQIASTKYYSTNYEKEVTGSNIKEWNYIAGGNGLAAIYIANNGTGALHYVIQDHLGSIMGLFNENGILEEEYSYDAWGRRRNPVNWSYSCTTPTLISRGYTGHEHLEQFKLINMNGRLYDPAIGQMLSPDNYIQNPNNTQNHNRYSYCLNNPLKYTDPTGDFFWIPAVIGAIAGGYTGYKIGEAKGAEGIEMFGYIAGGAVIGAAAGVIGAEVAAGGGFMANTMGIMYSSSCYSMGMSALSGGMMQPNISFGAASYNYGTNEWGYLGKEGNKWYENVGYGAGALANVQDVCAGFNGTEYDVLARRRLSGHSQGNGEYNGKEISISVGPNDRASIDYTSDGLKWEMQFVKATLKGRSFPGENVNYIDPNTSPLPFVRPIYNVNGNQLLKMTNRLNDYRNLLNTGPLKYGLFRGCVNYTSRSLLYAGVINVNAFLPITAPVLLNFELFARQVGIWSNPYLVSNLME